MSKIKKHCIRISFDGSFEKAYEILGKLLDNKLISRDHYNEIFPYLNGIDGKAYFYDIVHKNNEHFHSYRLTGSAAISDDKFDTFKETMNELENVSWEELS